MRKKHEWAPQVAISKDTRYRIIFGVVVLVFAVGILRSFVTSAFFRATDRTNIVFYGRDTALYSFGNADGVHYFVTFPPDSKIEVPGGYGRYRVGALYKLVSLERRPELFRRAFSAGIAAGVSYYFYPTKEEIYYGSDMSRDALPFPGMREIFFSNSNGNFFDRLYIYLQFRLRRTTDFSLIDTRTEIIDDQQYFRDDVFAKTYLGYFYHRTLRAEGKTVQLLYTGSYKTAVYVGRIIEGNGIRIVDMTRVDERTAEGKDCTIRDARPFSGTARELSELFGCSLIEGRGEVSDIIVTLGRNENDWEIAP